MQSSCDNEEECVLVFLASFGRTLLRARMTKSKEVAEAAEKNDRSSDFSRNNENEENCVVLRDRLFDNELSVVTETEWTLLPEGGDDKVCPSLLCLVGIAAKKDSGSSTRRPGTFTDYKLEDFGKIKSSRRSSGTERSSPQDAILSQGWRSWN